MLGERVSRFFHLLRLIAPHRILVLPQVAKLLRKNHATSVLNSSNQTLFTHDKNSGYTSGKSYETIVSLARVQRSTSGMCHYVKVRVSLQLMLENRYHTRQRLTTTRCRVSWCLGMSARMKQKTSAPARCELPLLRPRSPSFLSCHFAAELTIEFSEKEEIKLKQKVKKKQLL